MWGSVVGAKRRALMKLLVYSWFMYMCKINLTDCFVAFFWMRAPREQGWRVNTNPSIQQIITSQPLHPLLILPTPTYLSPRPFSVCVSWLNDLSMASNNVQPFIVAVFTPGNQRSFVNIKEKYLKGISKWEKEYFLLKLAIPSSLVVKLLDVLLCTF